MDPSSHHDPGSPPDDIEDDATHLPAGEEAGERIDGYRLLEKIGEGGMGEVWLAWQRVPVRRRVAIKVIKLGMDTRSVVARFEAERQALAMMDHSALARVYDAGATAGGRPYFVMEYVNGIPVTEYCDRHKLSTRERLLLFRDICAGVQHAHQKAIIHRDLKPSNVLVTLQDGVPLPKIIDFGVAKATARPLTDRTMFTELGALIGTPEYMSPEQAMMDGQDVDTRTDVYALGVILYELLTGELPFSADELRREGFDSLRKKICDVEPPRPSVRLSSLNAQGSRRWAAVRRDPAGTPGRLLAGDLDWITMKALEKDRLRRYGSPSELAEDVRRYLEDQAVAARPPSVVYRARKFVRRNRLLVGAASMVTVLLFAGLAGTTWGLLRARRAEARALDEARTAERVSHFLAGALGGVNPHQMGGRLVADLRDRVARTQRERGASEAEVVRAVASLEFVNGTDAALRLIDEEILARAGETIRSDLADDPLITARLEQTLGDTYARLGMLERAEPHARSALQIRTRVLGEDDPDALATRYSMAVLLARQGKYEEAERALEETLGAQRRVLGAEHPAALTTSSDLANVYEKQGRFEEAERLHAETLTARRRVLGDEHAETLSSMNNLANVYERLSRYAEAAALHEETLAIRRRILGPDHPQTLSSMNNLAIAAYYLGRWSETARLFGETLETRQRLLGSDNPATLDSMSNLGELSMGLGRYDEAERLHAEVLAARRRMLGDEHERTLVSMASLAAVHTVQGRLDEAERLAQATRDTVREVLGAEHPHTLSAEVAMADILRRRGRHDEAAGRLESILARQIERLGAEHVDVASTMYAIACNDAARGRIEAARTAIAALAGRAWQPPWDILDDPALDPLRDDPAFRKLAESVRSRAAG